MELDFESLRREAQEQITERMGELTSMMSKVSALQAEARASMGTADSRDRLISVTVNASGVPIEIELDSSVYSEYSPSELSAELLSVAQDAAVDVQEKVGAITTRMQAAARIEHSDSIIPEIPGINDLLATQRPSVDPPTADSRLRREFDGGGN
ncbi:YbaB/EbfC family nucleoid-associated protein [Williamsia sp. MIQD14]|uniref:YbaB/EbfC family nucleoid-associated protein n=1 Tax=Williamsia sp. MIQD14 TaxID=3425703 RepID=UPI003DA037A6